MGMFDYIVIDGVRYQTKSLDNTMDEYYLKEGRLFKEQCDYVWVDSPDAFLGGFLQAKEETCREVVLDDLHGDIIFYEDYPSTEDITYRARFSYGKLDTFEEINTKEYYESPLHERNTLWKKVTSP